MPKALMTFAGMFALSAISVARAADLPQPPPPPPTAPAFVPASRIYNWTGFYVGGNVGGGWDNSSTTINGVAGTPTGGSGTFNTSGFLGGGQIGFNYQMSPNWVAGIEADADWSGIKGSSSSCFAVGCQSNNHELDDFGTVRGRVGYAWNNVLFYGTGGWAWGENKTTTTITSAPLAPAVVGSTATASGAMSGWTAGAGIEWAFAPNWTVRAEYLHLQFDDVGRTFVFPAFTSTTSTNIGVEIGRVGLNYKFGWGP